MKLKELFKECLQMVGNDPTAAAILVLAEVLKDANQSKDGRGEADESKSAALKS
jgi:hypothetical protein